MPSLLVMVPGATLLINGGLRLVRRQGAIVGASPENGPIVVQTLQRLPQSGRFSFMQIAGLYGGPFTYRGWLIANRLCSDIPRQTMPDPALVDFGAGT